MEPDWSAIEWSIEEALLGVEVERFLYWQEVQRRMAGVDEARRILLIAQVKAGEAAAEAAAALDDLFKAWNTGPDLN